LPYLSFAAPPPNIVYILADDLGIGDLGAYGQTRIRTPHIDGLAKEGIRFTNHYSGNTVCAPSRASLMTGLHMGHAPIRQNDLSTLTRQTLTVAQILKQAGYATGCIGKWGMGDPGSQGAALLQGFDFFYGYYDQTAAHNHYPTSLYRDTTIEKLDGKTYSTDRFNEEALAFLDRNKSKPFYLFLTYTLTHANLQVPSQGAYAAETWPNNERIYAAMTSYLDSSVGLVQAKLKALGLDGNTLVLFASDNGPHAEGGQDPAYFDSNGPYRGIKRDGYDGGIHVPFIARWPGKIAAGTTSDWIGYFADFLPTMCELAGYNAPTGIDGLSYLPTLLGKPGQQKAHGYLYWEFNGDGKYWVAARKGKWKGLLNKATGAFELFDLEQDAGETKNLAAQFPAVADSLKAIFTAAHTDGTPVITMPKPVAVVAKAGRTGASKSSGPAFREDGRFLSRDKASGAGDKPEIDALGKSLPR
jgi:arylsulfatase A-like enzyme